MQDHTVTIDDSVSPSKITYAPVFNVAIPFIDRHLVEGRGDKVALRTAGQPDITFRELADGVSKAGNVLLSAGVKPGERVLMVIKDCPHFHYVFWGAIKAGIIAVPLNTLLKAKDYKFMIGDSGCTALVYSPEFAGEVEAALGQIDNPPATIMKTEGTGSALTGLMKDASITLEPAPTTEDQDCFWLYSSGTTGTPKGAIHRHRDMVVTSQHYGVEVLGIRESDVTFSAAKLFFAYGLGNNMTFPLWVGATAVLYPGPPTPDSMFETIETYRPSIYYGVPTLYAAQLRALEQAPRDTGSLRICVSAGEALPGDIFRRWEKATGTRILDGIGSTEALHIFISNLEDDVKPGSSGRIVPGYEARVLDEKGMDAPDGEAGKLVIRGASTARIYWNNPEKTADTMLADGWLNTGDTYIRDAEGYFTYCGRSDDMMKVGGIWCSPFEIEARLIEHPKVLEAAVVGEEDEAGLTKPKAYIVLKEASDAGDAMAADLIEHCKDGLARYKYPRWFEFVDSLPKTATGKIQRFRLRAGGDN
jgi:benzoate-CoA ligase family protein